MAIIRKFQIAIAVGLALIGCSRAPDRKIASHSRFTTTIASDVPSFDPVHGYSSQFSRLAPNFYEALYQYAYLSDPVAIEPLLAEALPKVSADRLTATIRIKAGVHFADDPCFRESAGKGREVTAQDFIYAWKRNALPSVNSNGWWIFDGKIVGFTAFHDRLEIALKEDVARLFASDIEGLSAPDRYTIRIRLTKPCPQLTELLSLPPAAVIPREAVEAYGNENQIVLGHPVGTGPYLLAQHTSGVEIRLTRNPNFHAELYPSHAAPPFKSMLEDAGRRLPLTDEISYRICKETWTNWLEFLKGNRDVNSIPKDAFNQVVMQGGAPKLTPEMAARGIRLELGVALSMNYISFNMSDPVLGPNKPLRQAISSAIDRDEWIRLFLNGTASPMVSVLPPGVIGRPESPANKYGFDRDRARKLLAEAGFPGGRGLPEITLDMGLPGTTNRQLGELFTRQLAEVGIRVLAQFASDPVILQKRREGNFQMMMDGWGMDYPDPENNYMILYGPNSRPGPNINNFNDPEYNRIFETMATEEPGPERERMIGRLDEIVKEEVPWIMGVNAETYTLAQSWVKNFREHIVIWNGDKYFSVSPH